MICSNQSTLMATSTTADRWRRLAFAAALAVALMDLLDSTIAKIAAPAIWHRPRWPAQPGPTSSGGPRSASSAGTIAGRACHAMTASVTM
jgi:hypothetical protein